MSTPIRNRLPVSPVNVFVIGLLIAGAFGTALVGHWGSTVVFLLGAVAMFALARAARRPEASDIARVNALEYRDERDWRIALGGLSAVGAIALVLTFLEFLVLSVVRDDNERSDAPPLVTAHLVLFCVVWGVANARITRRS